MKNEEPLTKVELIQLNDIIKHCEDKADEGSDHYIINYKPYKKIKKILREEKDLTVNSSFKHGDNCYCFRGLPVLSNGQPIISLHVVESSCKKEYVISWK